MPMTVSIKYLERSRFLVDIKHHAAIWNIPHYVHQSCYRAYRAY